MTVEAPYVETYAGQVALLTLASLLARMTPSVSVRLEDTEVAVPTRYPGISLAPTVRAVMHDADPQAPFEIGPAADGDFEIHVGRLAARAVHGFGWDAYFGPGPSPITEPRGRNPFGPAFAAILAAADVFIRNFAPGEISERLIDTFQWRSDVLSEGPALDMDPELGRIWLVGSGSVGTAVLYFLTMCTRSFACSLFDRDVVKVENLDRSPTFRAQDVGHDKVASTADFLRAIGVPDVHPESHWLHESERWANRRSGVPNLIISTANEHRVRYRIEAGFPPLQIYGTTGRNWQASVIRHIPMVEACSLCLFPGDARPSDPSTCAIGTVEGTASEPVIDASLPFLSFGAGLMAAAEIAKSTLLGFPFGANRVCWNSRAGTVIPAGIPRVPTCLCTSRNRDVHQALLG